MGRHALNCACSGDESFVGIWGNTAGSEGEDVKPLAVTP